LSSTRPLTFAARAGRTGPFRSPRAARDSRVADVDELRELLDTLDLLAYERRTRSVVVNAPARGTASHRAAVEKALKGGWLLDPVQRDVPVSINRGIPLAASQPDHPVSVAVRQFAATRLLAVQPGCVSRQDGLMYTPIEGLAS